MNQNIPVEYNTETKLRYEIEKLRAETQHLTRPWLHNPASWITILTTVIALGSVGFQAIKSDYEYRSSQIKLEQAKLDIEKTADKNERLNNEVARAEMLLNQVNEQREQAQSELASLETQANKLKELAAQLPANAQTSELKDVAQKTSRSIDQLRTINKQSVAQSEETAGNLRAIRESLSTPQTASNNFAVVASFKTESEALVYAGQLKAKGLIYSVEVFKREADRYAVTLGGNLSYREASARVQYAKQNGIASDAYVRPADNWGENLFK